MFTTIQLAWLAVDGMVTDDAILILIYGERVVRVVIRICESVPIRATDNPSLSRPPLNRDRQLGNMRIISLARPSLPSTFTGEVALAVPGG